MSDTKNRMPRNLETREKTSRRKRWSRPNVLPSPDPRDGWEHRWIRVAINGQADPTNISSKLREGWEPCRIDDYPEIQIVYEESKNFKGNVVMGGQMLCRAPVEMVEERNGFYKTQTAAQMRSVNENLMNENDPRMPVFNESKSSVKFGEGALKGN